MYILRKIGLGLALFLLPVFLFVFGLGFSIYQVYGSPEHIKHALEKSGAYDTFIADITSQSNREGELGELREGIPADRPEVKQIIKDAAPPEFLKTQAEGFLDGIYTWVRGESNQLRFEINLVDAKERLADDLAQYANERLATLPACTEPLNFESAASFDALNATCVPPGTNPALATAQVRQEVDEIFENPIITQEDLKNDDSRTIEEQLAGARNAYNDFVTGLWVTGLASLLLAAGVVALSRPWRDGLKRLGIVFVIVGAVSAVLAVVGAFLFKRLAESLASEAEIQASMARVASILADDFRNWWLGYGLIVLGLGIGALVALRFVHAEQKDGENEKNASASEKHTAHQTAGSENNSDKTDKKSPN